MPTIQEWTADQVAGGKVVGVDPTVVTAQDARKLADKIKKKGGEYKAVDQNLIDLVWGSERPSRPSEKVSVQPVKYSGKSFEDKLEELRKELEKRKSLGFVVSMLDEIAWLYNLRGNEYVDPISGKAALADRLQYPVQPSVFLVCRRHSHDRHALHRRLQVATGSEGPSQ